ncbi:VOC family protein [Nocardiopsis sp. HNM0947]|uniref:VOC family protein n=1 Tax=Nocardiopsis coralli TaxID=2772213 RepID=A0ABR9PBZ9_9ACTN|nr:VOC family protein [Nocardiopsis coralli]MBE3001373.1 VOC family protein [Nocardiopsis coralli]
MARIRDLVVDCRHPASLARFWAAALDGYAVAPYDAQELERLRALGVNGPEEDPVVLVEGPQGLPNLFFQQGPEPKSGKNRLHVDLAGADGELERLLSLGAAVIARSPEWVVLADPEGNEFCLMDG